MAKPVLDPEKMNRLAFIRLLYQQAVQQSQQPVPLSAASILTFHDAVEQFLILAAEHRKAGPVTRDGGILQYWTALRPRRGFATGVELSGQHGMGRLNSVRNDLKHLGALPSSDAVTGARSDVTSFLEDNTPKVFGVEFTSIDMAEIIPQAEARATVKEATAAELAGDRMEAMGKLAEAFNQLTGDRPSPGPRRKFGIFGPTIRPQLRKDQIISILAKPNGDRRGPVGGTSRLAEEIAQVVSAGQAMQTGLRIMALGIDYRQFDRFQQLTPRIIYSLAGSDRLLPRDYAPTSEEFDYCRQFIIAVALRMAELEAHTARPSWQQP